MPLSSKESSRKYYLKHRDKILAKRKEYVLNHIKQEHAYSIKYRERNHERINIHNKKRYAEDKDYQRSQLEFHRKHRQNNTDASKRYYHRNKEKWLKRPFTERMSARGKLNYAVKVGKIIKPEVCDICKLNKDKIMAHHEDYSKPLDVVWVCWSCHGKKHRTYIFA